MVCLCVAEAEKARPPQVFLWDRAPFPTCRQEFMVVCWHGWVCAGGLLFPHFACRITLGPMFRSGGRDQKRSSGLMEAGLCEQHGILAAH